MTTLQGKQQIMGLLAHPNAEVTLVLIAKRGVIVDTCTSLSTAVENEERVWIGH